MNLRSGLRVAIAVWCLATASGSAQAVRVGVHCEQLAPTASLVEKALCSNPDLLAANNDIDALTITLEQTFVGLDRDALLDSEQPFIVTRNGCSNAPHAHNDVESQRVAVRDCVMGVLEARKGVLEQARLSPNTIRATISQYKDGLTIPMLLKYADLFVGQQVRVVGCMRLDSGTDSEARTSGRLLERCHVDPRGLVLPDSGPRLPVRFKSMNETDAWFLDYKVPFSWWTGTVQRRDGGILLFVDDMNK